MIDKILSMFGLVRCLEYKGELWDYNGFELYIVMDVPAFVKYHTNWTLISSCIAMGAKSRIVSTNSFKAHQAMRCL